ncbi:hypothetical protein GF336_00295 [Candidatus Woesearchaeota archaeon]|nr:hypothetical protein [Candidatus Woesearchaeota archaeon]
MKIIEIIMIICKILIIIIFIYYASKVMYHKAMIEETEREITWWEVIKRVILKEL